MFKQGQKVKVVKNNYKYMPGYAGKRGKVSRNVTEHSCFVKLVGGPELWFSNEELELDK